MEPQPVPSTPDPGRLSAGSALGGGRYTIGKWVRRGLFADQYEATDSTTGGPVSIHLLAPDLVKDGAAVTRIESDVRDAQAIVHKHVLQIIEMSAEGNHVYLVTDLVEGHTVRELLERKQKTGSTGFGAKGATNIITHVCNALAAAHEHVSHGAVTLESVTVSRAGRIKVGDFGLSSAIVQALKARPALSGIAPEVAKGGAGSPHSDVYSAGALLYEILVGQPPVRGCKRPSEVIEGLPGAVDVAIAKSMLPDPAKRFANTTELRDEITRALSMARTSGQYTAAAASASTSTAGASPAASGSLAASRSGASPAVAAPAGGPSLAESIAMRTSGQMPAATAEAALPVSAALEAAMADRQERWLISKGKLDYGPYTLAHVADDIKADKVLPGHVIIDNDTGSRTKVEDHPLLGELVDAAKERRDERRRAQAEVSHAHQEKRRGATLYIFIALGVLALGGGAYFLVDKLSSSEDKKSAAIEGLEGGALQAKISFPSKAERKRRARTGSRKGSKGSPSGGVAGGWDDTLDLDMSGDDDGASERLDDSDVNPVIQRSGGGLGRCLTSTSTHNAVIEFHVQPNGRVSQVRVNRKTDSPVAKCVRGVMKKMQFPTFNGVRSKHYFDMSY